MANKKKLTAEQLEAQHEAYMSQRQRAIEQAKWEQKKAQWVEKTTSAAEELAEKMAQFKQTVQAEGNNLFRELYEIYGQAPSTSPSLTNLDGTMKVVFDRQDKLALDETATIGVGKIKAWMDSRLKGSSKEAHAILSKILAKKKDEWDALLLVKLKQLVIDGTITDPEFIDGVRLIEQSAQVVGTGEYVRFYKANEQGKMENISLQFSAI